MTIGIKFAWRYYRRTEADQRRIICVAYVRDSTNGDTLYGAAIYKGPAIEFAKYRANIRYTACMRLMRMPIYVNIYVENANANSKAYSQFMDKKHLCIDDMRKDYFVSEKSVKTLIINNFLTNYCVERVGIKADKKNIAYKFTVTVEGDKVRIIPAIAAVKNETVVMVTLGAKLSLIAGATSASVEKIECSRTVLNGITNLLQQMSVSVEIKGARGSPNNEFTKVGDNKSQTYSLFAVPKLSPAILATMGLRPVVFTHMKKSLPCMMPEHTNAFWRKIGTTKIMVAIYRVNFDKQRIRYGACIFNRGGTVEVGENGERVYYPVADRKLMLKIAQGRYEKVPVEVKFGGRRGYEIRHTIEKAIVEHGVSYTSAVNKRCDNVGFIGRIYAAACQFFHDMYAVV